MSRDDAVRLLSRAPFVRLASVTDAGQPVLKTLNAVVVGQWLLFHGSKVGEKVECLGQPVVMAAEEVVASIPSYFVDPVFACPATTLYRSVQVHGVLERIDDVDLKARMLGELMQKYQPEGGYKAITADAPEYARVVRGIVVAGVRLDDVTGKQKLGQNRSPAELERVVLGLWRRGAPGDAEAIEAILEANPKVPVPEFLRGPGGLRLVCALPAEDVDTAVGLVTNTYWRRGCSSNEIRASFVRSTTVVAARSPDGDIIGTARAVSDSAWHAYIADVAVAEPYRHRGIGRALMGLLLDHPAVRNVAAVRLATLDAQPFYAELGFVEYEPQPGRPTVMIRKRRAPDALAVEPALEKMGAF